MAAKEKIVTSLIWRFLERCGAQGVTVIVSIVLARLLDPKVYGIIALMTVFTTVMQVFVDSGLGNALIQKKDADDLDFSSVFYFNVCMCLSLYVLMFFISPFIANFYGMPEITAPLRVLSLVIIVSGLKNVQQAYVSRYLLFKKFFYATLVGTIVAGVIGVLLAYKGYGVWALVGQMVINTTIDTIILWIVVPWRPIFAFSIKRLKRLVSFGWKLLASALLETVFNKLRQLIIGKMYSTEDLALYDKGDLFPSVIVSNINTSIDSVLLPILSAEQDSNERVKSMTSRAIKVGTYIIMPLMMGLAVCAEPIVVILLTEKWLPCVPYLRIFCFTYAFYPLHTTNLNAIKAVGRSDLFLKLEIIKKIVGLAALLGTMKFGVMAMAYSTLITSVIYQVINSWPNKKLINYSYISQLRDMFPQLIISCIMGAIVFLVNFLNLSDALTLAIQVPLGVFLYFALSKIFKIDSFEYVILIVKKLFKKEEA